jgi:hypothetical protein
MADLENLRYPCYPTEEQCNVRRTVQMVFSGSPLPLDKVSKKHIELIPFFHLDLRPEAIASIYGDAFKTSTFHEQFWGRWQNSTVILFDEDYVSFAFENLKELGMRIELHRNDTTEIVQNWFWIKLQDGDVFKILQADTELMCMRYLFQNPSPSE